MNRRRLMTAGVERQGFRLSLSHIAEGEWRPKFRPDEVFGGYGVNPAR